MGARMWEREAMVCEEVGVMGTLWVWKCWFKEGREEQGLRVLVAGWRVLALAYG